MAPPHCQGTILGVDDGNFEPEKAADRLRRAMRGLGTDEHEIIKVLTEHNNAQRQKIKDMYKTSFGRDLIEDLKSELAGNFEDLCLYLLMPARYFDTFCLKNAFQRLLIGTKEISLIDILVSRSNSEIEEIKHVYKDLFHEELEDNMISETSGDFKRVLVALLQGMRDEEQEVDEDAAEEDAVELYNAGEGMKWGTDEDVLTKVLVNRSVPRLRKAFELYKKKADKDIEDSISCELSGDTLKTFLSIVQYIKDPLKFFAKCLFESMAGMGTDDERLMQLIVSHSEVDLQQIAEVYEKEYGATLAKHIHDDTSGDYRKLLLKILDQSIDTKDLTKQAKSKR